MKFDRCLLWRDLMVGLVLGLVLLPVPAQAQLLDDVEPVRGGSTTRLALSFSQAIQYRRHLPLVVGKEVTIYLRPVSQQARIPGERLYRSSHTITVNGKKLRVSVFEERPQAKDHRVTLRFSRKLHFKILPGRGGSSIDIVLSSAKKRSVKKKSSRKKTVAKSWYAIRLGRSKRKLSTQIQLPRSLDKYRIYVSHNKKTGYQLLMGLFPSRSRAKSLLPGVRKRYPSATVVKLTRSQIKLARKSRAKRSSSIAVELTDAQISKLLADGEEAIRLKKYAKAAGIFSRIVESGNDESARKAHELLAVSYERAGKKKQARVEYRLYLRNYPDGEGSTRVAQRLAVLEGGRAPRLRPRRKLKKDKEEWNFYGTWAQSYYRGKRQTDTTTINGPVIVEEPTLTNVDQSSLITNLDVIGRYRSKNYDQRIVLSGDYSHDYIDNESDGRVSNAYYQLKNKPQTYFMKLGRQSGRAGALGRFDGLIAGVNVTPKTRWNIIAGEPFNEVAPGSDRSFAGTSFDFGTFARRWAGSLYYIEHKIDEMTDRQAVGADLRYFNQSNFFYTLADYDIYFDELNIFMLQAGWQTKSKTSFNLLMDYRKNPVLQLSNLLLGELNVDSIEQLKETYTEDEMRQLALDRTTESMVASLGVMQPLTANLRVGADATLTKVNALPASGLLPATPGTGNVITYGIKMIANKVLTSRDITLLGVTYTKADTLDEGSFYITERARWQHWLFDLGLKWYERENITGVEVSRYTPSLRVEYKWNSMALELEYGQEQTDTIAITQEESTVRDYYSVGYRWEF
ncbi:MAG: tetratricopeptide repeat protein [Proteobacteria bacterium]|nr:tetratricopeptide repeat protein [Pseudomonadota bacterium]